MPVPSLQITEAHYPLLPAARRQRSRQGGAAPVPARPTARGIFCRYIEGGHRRAALAVAATAQRVP